MHCNLKPFDVAPVILDLNYECIMHSVSDYNTVRQGAAEALVIQPILRARLLGGGL